MNFEIEKKISNFVSSQFPQFYLSEGENFILFVKAYYEWMETEGQVTKQARSLLDYRDIDNTLDKFLSHFQQKYLYGIPFEVIVNPRYLLKHILDVYRSKGTIQCYKLLFKLIYNQDVEVYLPGRDILKPSDNHWVQPKYVEVTDTPVLSNYVGKTVIGLSSGTTAVVESFIKEPINKNIVSSLFLTKIQPQGGSFKVGEKIVVQKDQANGAAITAAPSVVGSFSSLNIVNGGQNLNVGDILKVVHRDLTNNAVVSYGVNGLVKVTQIAKGQGSLNFDIINNGFGITSNAQVFVYRGQNDTTGQGGSFEINSLTSTQQIVYNTDIIGDYYNLAINASQYNFPSNATGNNTSTLASVFNYANQTFGSLSSLTNIKTGNGYTNSATVFVRSTQVSNVLTGSVTYNTASNNVTFSTTNAQFFFSANDVIFLQANSTLSSTIEYGVIKTVVNTSVVTLYAPPSNNSTPSSKSRLSPSIIPSQFSVTEVYGKQADGTIDGLNTLISASAASNGNIVSAVSAVNSGKGYVDNEFVELYLSGGLSGITVNGGGSGYANGDSLIFVGGGSFVSYAKGFVTTNSSGVITSATLSANGSGYESPPVIYIKSKNGSGASLSAGVSTYNTLTQVTGRVVKTGVGVQPGYWATTQSFLNSDKYIQDSHFYQDFSYQLKTAATLDKYKDVLYNTFHTAGSELFGQFLLSDIISEPAAILYDESAMEINNVIAYYLTSDSTTLTADDYNNTADQIFVSI